MLALKITILVTLFQIELLIKSQSRSTIAEQSTTIVMSQQHNGGCFKMSALLNNVIEMNIILSIRFVIFIPNICKTLFLCREAFADIGIIKQLFIS